jgi:hypothetical protein
MFSPLDIFKTDSDGGVLWRGAAEDFVSAKRCIEKLALSAPGEYLILNQRTGQRMRVAFPDNALSSPDGGTQYIEMSLTSLII